MIKYCIFLMFLSSGILLKIALLGVLKQNQNKYDPLKWTSSVSQRYKAVNRSEGLTGGFAECWRIQLLWRSFDRQPLSSLPHCHRMGRQSGRLPWSTVSWQIYHIKSPLAPRPGSLHLSAPHRPSALPLYTGACFFNSEQRRENSQHTPTNSRAQ